MVLGVRLGLASLLLMVPLAADASKPHRPPPRPVILAVEADAGMTINNLRSVPRKIASNSSSCRKGTTGSVKY